MSTAILERPVDTDIDAQIVEVTPDLAQHWLGLNTSNRKIKPGNVGAYARDMADGRWVLNGEAIKFTGPSWQPTKLVDGQNRLLAVLKSKSTVRMLVVFNVPTNAQSTMDSGSKRTVADNLAIGGVQNAHIVASAAAMAIRFADGYYAGFAGSTTNSRVLEFAENWGPELHRAAAIASTYAARADVPKSVVAYTHFRFSQIDLDDATAFWRDAAEKIGLTSGDPILAMTSRFSSARRNKERVAAGTATAAIFRVWNARRKGDRLRTVVLTPPTELPSLR